jgi:hypothetical protein
MFQRVDRDMEHRHHQRVPVDIRAFIYQRGLPVATGRVRNASRRGFFIETDYGDLQTHQRVQCELHPGEGPGGGPRRVLVCVVRCSPEGAGVELDEGDGPLATAVIACARTSGAADDVRSSEGAMASLARMTGC